MLDQVDAVRAICEANSGIQSIHGPHGITLLSHARHGKAERVMAYLEKLGGADVGQPNLGLDEQSASMYTGDYEPEAAPGVIFRIAFRERNQGLTFQRDERQLRFLNHADEHVFSPGGAADVRIVFDVRNGRAVSIAVNDGELAITAKRIT